MINLDFSIAVSLYIIVALNILLALWVFGRKQKGSDLTLDERFLWFCSICTYTYINTREEAISVCPRCGSYNKREAPWHE